MRIKIWKSKRTGLYRFRLIAANNRVVAIGEDYKNWRDIRKTLRHLFKQGDRILAQLDVIEMPSVPPEKGK